LVGPPESLVLTAAAGGSDFEFGFLGVADMTPSELGDEGPLLARRRQRGDRNGRSVDEVTKTALPGRD